MEPIGTTPTAGAPTAGAPTAGPPSAETAGAGAPRPVPTILRSRSDRMLAGVCGGTGHSLGVDPALLRIGLVLLTVFGMGVGVVVYLAAWILMPQD